MGPATSAVTGQILGCGSSPGGMAEEAAKQLKLVNVDDEAMTFVSCRPLEPFRRKVIQAAFPTAEGDGQVLAIVAKGPSSEFREFIAVLDDGATAAKLISASCQITYEDLTPSECVEYSFPEEPDVWRLAQLSRAALDQYRSMKFENWKQMLLHSTCEAQFRRMLQIGLVTQMYDPHVFPTPELLKSKYQVTDDRTGKRIELPHPVKQLRAWNAEKLCYENIDPHLTGAPSEAEKASWWAEFVAQLEAGHGKEYIASLMSS